MSVRGRGCSGTLVPNEGLHGWFSMDDCYHSRRRCRFFQEMLDLPSLSRGVVTASMPTFVLFVVYEKIETYGSYLYTFT